MSEAPSALSGSRVLAIAPTPFFSDYGCHVRIFEEVSALQAHGVATTVATYPFGRDLPGLDVRRSRHIAGPREVSPGSSLHKFSMDVALAGCALRAARSTRPHLIHGHLHEGALLGWALARRRGIPLVFDFQGSLTAEMIDHGFLSEGSPAYWAFRSVERWVVDHADAIVTSTHHGAEFLSREFSCPEDRITVVPDGVNAHRFCPLWIEGGTVDQKEVACLRAQLGLPEGKPVVVYLGLLAEYQGITHLLRAAQTLVEGSVDVHFLIMGFPGEERYGILAERLGIGKNVTFTGAIPYERAGAYLSLGDVAVAPKLSLTEGNGKLVNYMAMGLPVVVFDSVVSREILGDLGIYAPRGDWSALAVEIAQALADLPTAQERGRALRAKAESEHSWESSISLLMGVYERALARHKAAGS